jgi:hypothetical protein
MYIQKRKEDVPKFCRFSGCPCDSGCQLFLHCNGWLRTYGQRNSEHSGQAACVVAPPSAVAHKTEHCESYKTKATNILFRLECLQCDDNNNSIELYFLFYLLIFPILAYKYVTVMKI